MADVPETLDLVYHMWRGARTRARREGLPFNLTQYDIEIPEVCPALGLPLAKGDGKIAPNSPTLDRLRPEAGYVKGNVSVISSLANRIKQNATVEQVEAVAQWMRSREDR